MTNNTSTFKLPPYLADSIAGETTTTENVGRMHSSATFIGGTGTSQSWYNGQKVSDQLASVDEAEFDQDQEEVGGKWSNRWNKFKKVVDGIDKINNIRKEMGFDADATESVGTDIDFGSAETLSDQSSPEFTDTSYSDTPLIMTILLFPNGLSYTHRNDVVTVTYPLIVTL